MAPSRGRGKAPATASRRTAAPSTRRSGRSTRSSQATRSDIYEDMLAAAAAAEPTMDYDRPLKRRKALREVSISHFSPTTAPDRQLDGPADPQAPASGTQIIESSSDDENDECEHENEHDYEDQDEDESDFAFEDVDLSGPPVAGPAKAEDAIADVSVPVEQTLTRRKRTQVRRKPASVAEKAQRLVLHKAHVLCLLGHCIHVNSWCNDAKAQQYLQSLLTPKMRLYLNPKCGLSQFDWNRLFMDGLQQVSDMFRLRFQVTTSGLQRLQWASGGDEKHSHADDINPIDRAKFIEAASKLEGSQDTGNQLFCALLRAAGVEARLVCSLQPLPFTSATPTPSPKKVAKKHTIFAIAADTDPGKSQIHANDASVSSSPTIGNVPSIRRRLGQPTFSPMNLSVPSLAIEREKPFRKLSFPVFWVEAFNSAHQKWIPLDPIVTGTFNKLSRLEPPVSYESIQLSYAIAFESSGVAKDVTRRYAKAYNAKTRRLRVERTGEEGTQWWRKTMRFFRRRGGLLDREQVEDAELAQREAREGMPNNVQDFKEHPVYVLERHLRRHEVISPKREVGKVNVGTAAKPRMEAVYRRSDVVTCKSADKWYRLGRVVKEGEQPLKQISIGHGRRARSLSVEESEGHRERMTGVYAEYQTDLYIPPPVSPSGRVPRNAFGNLDVYVPSMVPAGGVHVHHPLAAQAAKLLHVDHADAVTGFHFKGRHGTAIIEGAVVAKRYAEAVKAVIEGLEYEDEWERARRRSTVALRTWKRFLTGLRIAERVAAYGPTGGKVAVEGEAKVENDESRKDALILLPSARADEELVTAGKYSLDDLTACARKTRAKPRAKMALESDEEEMDDQEDKMADYEIDESKERYGEGGFLAEDTVKIDRDGDFSYIRQPDGGDGESGNGFITDEIMDTNDDAGDEISQEFPYGQENEDDGSTTILPDLNAETCDGDTGGGFLLDATNTSGESRVFGRDDAKMHVHYGDKIADQKLHDNALQTYGSLDSFPPANVAREIDSKVSGARLDSNPLCITTERDNSSGGPDLTANCHDTATGKDERETLHPATASDHLDMTDVQDDPEPEVGDFPREGVQSDQDSLLTHDPEDEDAEPDWLESE
ncbi:MAG: hypothetical protein FE78DRAFT_87514 [Acidomyces sp. 'richmondensis']|nr:MAG: hypothetical protein FE78DRAFT_87514 [Acidomyces sp. 'richmondensis']